jgi:uncharacterized protein (TIGR00255 family)
MTGFGTSTARREPLALRAEARSVNHRYLQVKTRLPAELQHLESDVEALVRKKLDRGSVVVTLIAERDGGELPVAVDFDAARRYAELLDRLARELGLPRDLGVAALVQLPGVVGAPADGRERDASLALGAVERAHDALIEMRASEGRSLAREMRKHCGAAVKLMAKVEKRMPQALRAHHESLRARVADLLGGKHPLSESDLAREIALLADRMDVSEELARLKSHLDQVDALLDEKGPVGRQLDFLVQELLREANTIGSKCNDAAVAQSVVELKAHIERLREQVQNVE